MIAVTRVMMKVDIPSSVVAPPPFPTLSILSIFTLTLSTFGNSPHKLKIFLKHEIYIYLIYVCTHDIAAMTMIYDNLRFLTNLCIHEFHDFKAVREGVKNLSHGIDH